MKIKLKTAYYQYRAGDVIEEQPHVCRLLIVKGLAVEVTEPKKEPKKPKK